jgi:hypothetical protein
MNVFHPGGLTSMERIGSVGRASNTKPYISISRAIGRLILPNLLTSLGLETQFGGIIAVAWRYGVKKTSICKSLW